jgi:HK97 family phage major capsid protein
MNRNLLLNADPTGSGGGGGTATPPKIEVNESAIRKSEQTRCAEILAIAGKFNIKPEDSQRFIAEGKGADEFRQFVLDNQRGAKPLLAEDPTLGLSEKEKDQFSIVRAINSIVRTGEVTGLEKEVTEAAAKRYKMDPNPRGFIIPHDVSSRSNMGLSQRATQIAGTANLGGFTVATQTGSMIEYLRNRTALGQLGVTAIAGLTGNIAFPVQATGATGYWVSETGNITGSNATFGQKVMTPKRVGAQIPLSLQLLAQASLDIEAWARQELMIVLALKKDLAGFVGSGAAGEPLGIANTSGINATVTYGGAAVWADIVEHETGIAVDNADIATMKFAVDAATVGKWKTILKDSVAGAGYLLSDNMTANGYQVVRTNQISTAHQSFFGCWDQLLMGSWAGQEVVVDPYGSNATAGTITVTVQELCDFLVRQPLAFNVSTDSAAQ